MGVLVWAITATFIAVVLASKVLELREDTEEQTAPQEVITDSAAPYKTESKSMTIKEEAKTNYFYE